MANTRILRKRRKAVRNIRKITRTMQLIATARYQKSFQRATRSQEYTAKLEELLADLSSMAGEVQHPLLKPGSADGQAGLIVITSNRGLCGGYNGSVLRKSMEHVREVGQNLYLEVAGKRGVTYFRFFRIAPAKSYVTLSEEVRYAEIEPIAQEFINRFISGELKSVHVAYMKFISAGVQRPTLVQLLPFSRPQAAEAEPNAGPQVHYEFSPSPQELLSELLPQAVRTRLYQYFLDAAVSEQVARMVAMKAATDAAGDMIKSITRQYNRARQTQITTELMEIIGGAAAME